MASPSIVDDVRVLYNATYSFVESPSIRVLVGSDEPPTPFFVHEALITQRSVFFAKAIGGDWKESAERSVPLPDDEPAVFSLYLMCLYTKTLPVQTPELETAEQQHQYRLLCKLYVLAEKLIDSTTKDTIFAALSAHAQEINFVFLPDSDAVQIIYEGTPENDAARRWLVNLYTDHGLCDDLGLCDELGVIPADFPKDFLMDLAVNMMAKRARPGAYKWMEEKLAQTRTELMVNTADLTRIKQELEQAKSEVDLLKQRLNPW
ncbi:hypothetical protein C7974DRAFT_450829 [Boeremia exigua]|uniref:uncharacterized protein n=1 Tax=Boeremia exigua TaxID=749465 RepID=UPI001E8E5418|nr:uncharacterized protein C7974DRAFT_450829 [Boeremia exigua]KAH6637781.1 hypothetical protein C7974DRAFT_450829 [Boeremia exigua]